MSRLITDADRAYILEQLKLAGRKAPNGVISAIADKLGVSRTVLFKIKNGEYYAHV